MYKPAHSQAVVDACLAAAVSCGRHVCYGISMSATWTKLCPRSFKLKRLTKTPCIQQTLALWQTQTYTGAQSFTLLATISTNDLILPQRPCSVTSCSGWETPLLLFCSVTFLIVCHINTSLNNFYHPNITRLNKRTLKSGDSTTSGNKKQVWLDGSECLTLSLLAFKFDITRLIEKELVF